MMTNLLRFDFNDRDGIFEVVENGDWVRATDYDALAAKLAEAERVARYETDIAQQALDQMRAAEQRVATLEAALPAVYRLALEDAAERLLAAVTREYKDHRDYRNAIRELPTPTAEELMARIQTGETDARA